MVLTSNTSVGFIRYKIFRSATMRCSVKMYVPLLWGLCVLFAKPSMTTSIPEAKSKNVTVEVNDSTRQPTTAHVNVLQSAAWTPEHKPEEAPAEQAVSPVVAIETRETMTVGTKTSSSGGSGDGSVAVTTVSAGTSSSGLPASKEGLIIRPEAPAGTTARGAAESSTAVSTATTETPPSTSMTRATAEAQTSIEVNTARGEPSTAVTTALTETQPGVTTAKDETRPSSLMTTATSQAQSLNYTTTDALNHTADQLFRSSTSSFTNKTATATTTAYATVSVSSLQPTLITGNTSELPSTTSLNNQNVSIFNQNLSSPTVSSPTPKTNPSSTRKSVSATSLLNSTTGPSETASPSTTGSPNSTTGNSTGAVGILIPLKPKRLPVSTTRSTPAATISPCEPSKNPLSNQIQPCSTRGVANQCLVIIASLAVLATIFMVSTIVLCVKLSARNYKGKRPQQSTEMMCISALLPEKTYTYTRQRNPVSNGVLVYPASGDSDEEGGDNLTLSSFLPDNDRYV